MYEIATEEEFYKHEYSGCIYSLSDTNNWRKKNNRAQISIGEEFYGAAEERLLKTN
jgi:predicted adenine nucleotide alpha hydrolase (AANH) superfamily ATPase